jgi:uncharacterized damage-inducible protein DinB
MDHPFAEAFRYKAWANRERLDCGERQWPSLPEEDACFFVRILHHTRADEAELARDIPFVFTDGDQGRMRADEMLLHLLTHGSNHRGMAARVLATHGLERPRDTFTRFLHLADPSRRSGTMKPGAA